MSTQTLPTANLVVDAKQRRQAEDLFEALDGKPERLIVEGAASTPHELAEILSTVLKVIASGGRVVIASLPEELTTTVAADQLGVSRPTLMKLIAEGRLASSRVGTHHRVKLSDVREFKRKRLEEQRRAFEDLSALSDEFDDF